MAHLKKIVLGALAIYSVSLQCGTILAQDTEQLRKILSYRPTQADVDIETPSADDIPKCKLDVERNRNGSGFVLYGPQQQLLRRFMDTNGDGQVDEFRYYKHGMEVYRDLDTNANSDIDQSRWLNMAGTRWGIDDNEDGKIDSWKIISAEEATREAVLALAAKDEQRLKAVLLTQEDIKTLGITGDAAAKLTKNITEASSQFRTVVGNSKVVNSSTKWLRFDCSMLMPNLIPAEPGKSTSELLVYENVMASIETNGQTGYLQVGEMVRVGDAWKLTRVPQPLDGEGAMVTEGGVLLQPTIAGALPTTEGLSPRMKELLDQLRDLDAKAPQANPTKQELTVYNVSRARLLDLLATEAGSDEERRMWRRQRIEGIAIATQMDSFPNGLDELKRAEAQIRQSGTDTDLLSSTVFHRLLAEYNLQMMNSKPADRSKLQEDWIKSLEGFVQEFSKSDDAADALLHLAMISESNGNKDKAKAAYQQLVTNYPQAAPAVKARGALKRLDLVGKPFRMTGKSLTGGNIDTAAYQGKVLAVVYWATWCQPCTEELPQIKELYRQHQAAGFEVLGINLDTPDAPIQQYIQNFAVPWPHIHEEGASDGRPAMEYGIISLPTIFLVDKKGVVDTAGATIEDLKTKVPELLKK